MGSTATIRRRNFGELIRGGIEPDDAEELQRISRALHKLDETACNWGLTHLQERREERLEQKAQEIAQRYGRTAYHQSDPRGWSLYVVAEAELRGQDIHAAYNYGLAVCPH